eukprot:4967044-Pyramimonas_sp.AAC.1
MRTGHPHANPIRALSAQLLLWPGDARTWGRVRTSSGESMSSSSIGMRRLETSLGNSQRNKSCATIKGGRSTVYAPDEARQSPSSASKRRPPPARRAPDVMPIEHTWADLQKE